MSYLYNIRDYYNPYCKDSKQERKKEFQEYKAKGGKVRFLKTIYNKHDYYCFLKKAYENKIKDKKSLTTFLNELCRIIDDFDCDPHYVNSLYDTERTSFGKLFFVKDTNLLEFIINDCFSDELKKDEAAIAKVSSKIGQRYLYSYYVDEEMLMARFTSEYRGETVTPERYAELLVENDSFRKMEWVYYVTVRDFYDLYNLFVPEEYKYNPDFLKKLCSLHPPYIVKLKEYINKTPGLMQVILNENASKGINMKRLSKEEKEFISQNKDLRTISIDDAPDKVVWIERCVGSNIYEKLRKKFGKSYDSKYPDKIDDKMFFIYKMISSNPLDMVLSNDYFSITDVDFIRSFLQYVDENKISYEDFDTEAIRNSMNKIIQRNAVIANEVFGAIMANKNHEANMKILTEKLGYTKNNFFDKVKNHKYWDKEMKEAILLTLSSYFKTNNVITVYDVIDLLEEMSERGLTKEEILQQRNINPKFFDKLYKGLKDSNPELFELVRSKFQENSLKGFKKLLMLYHAIMDSKITDPEEFLVRFKRTPEQAIEFFANTEFAKDVYNKITSWYTPETVDTGSGNKTL